MKSRRLTRPSARLMFGPRTPTTDLLNNPQCELLSILRICLLASIPRMWQASLPSSSFALAVD